MKNSPQGKWIQVSNLNFSLIQENKENLEIAKDQEDWRKEIIDFIKGSATQEDKFEERRVKNQEHTTSYRRMNFAEGKPTTSHSGRV